MVKSATRMRSSLRWYARVPLSSSSFLLGVRVVRTAAGTGKNFSWRHRQNGPDNCAAARRRLDFKYSVELLDAFAHAGNPHAEERRPGAFGVGQRKTGALVADLDADSAIFASQPDGNRGAGGIAMNVVRDSWTIRKTVSSISRDWRPISPTTSTVA